MYSDFYIRYTTKAISNTIGTIQSSQFTFCNCCCNLYHGVKGHVQIYKCFHRGSCQSSASFGTVSKRQILLCKFHIYSYSLVDKNVSRIKLKQMISEFQLTWDIYYSPNKRYQEKKNPLTLSPFSLFSTKYILKNLLNLHSYNTTYSSLWYESIFQEQDWKRNSCDYNSDSSPLLHCQCWVPASQIHWVFGMCYQIWSWYFPRWPSF